MNQHQIHCLKCKGMTGTGMVKVEKTRNGRYRMHGKCVSCGGTKSKFITQQHGEGLLSGLLGFKDGFPFINKIPILGDLL